MSAWSAPKPDRRLDYSDATRTAIEARRSLEVIAASCTTDLGRAWVVGLQPTAESGDLEARRRDVDAVVEVEPGGRLVPSLPPLVGLRKALSSKRAEVNPVEVRLLAMAVETTCQAVDRLTGSGVEAPIVSAAASLPDFSTWGERALASLDERGEVVDDATPRLQSLLSSFRSQRGRLRNDLEAYLRQQPDRIDDTISMRDGRLTVLLRATSEEAGRGVRHGVSGSGQSVYVEPMSAVEANNQLRQTAAEAEAERHRILADLLDFVGDNRPAIVDVLDWLAMADGVHALAHWQRECDGCWPQVGESVEVEEFCHPLLDRRFEAVRDQLFERTHHGAAEPLTLAMSDRRLLVITGPNAGGKTVALKSVGLAVMLNQCGVPLPATRAELPLFGYLEALIGDDQDLMSARSTFSGRLERLREVWQNADVDSLVLIDELGSGTDPEEGSALALSLLEELARRRSATIATTHLITIAAFAADHPQGAAAAMTFADGAPTFRLVFGTPGESHALDLARRLDLAPAWLDRAEELLGSERVSLSRLMQDLEEHRRALRQQRATLEGALEEAEAERTRAAEESQALADERREAAVSLRRQQDQFERRALKRIDAGLQDLERDLRQEGAAARVDPAERGKVLKQALADRPRPEADLGPAREWQEGDSVRHRVLSWSGTVLETKGDSAQVAAGGKKIWVAAADLAPDESSRRPRVTTERRRPTVDEPSEKELKLLGLTVDDALDVLDDFLLRAHADGASRVRVIHGHGTGRLRKAVRQFVRQHSVVAGAEPAAQSQGGNGATIVELAD